MLSHPLLPKLKELRLSGMVDSLEERAELAREQKLTPVECLALMIDDEIERRRQTLVEADREVHVLEKLRQRQAEHGEPG